MARLAALLTKYQGPAMEKVEVFQKYYTRNILMGA